MRQAANPIPRFFLYGEAERQVASGFVHVESLDDRSRPSEWTIRTHVHRDLGQIILIAEGGGTMRAETCQARFDAPCLLLMPAGAVHGFAWHRDSRGLVCTVADTYLHQLAGRDDAIAALFRHPQAVPLPPAATVAIAAAFATLDRELACAGPAQRAAIDSALLAILVQAVRAADPAASAPQASRRQAALIARLRARIEHRFQLREPVGAYASALGVSKTALRLACAQVAGISPATMLDDRAILEAKRLLAYSSLPISQVASAAGFQDAAYFSRFFLRHAGQSPSAFRAHRTMAPPERG